MKSWGEMDAAGRGGVVAVVGAVIAGLLYGAWTMSHRPAVQEAEAPAEEAVPEADGEAAPAQDATAAVDAGQEETAEAATAPVAEAAPLAVTEALVDAGPGAEMAQTEPSPTAAGGASAVVAEAADAETTIAESPVEPAPVSEAPEPPRFDLVRVEQDGSALVAGSASPGATVSLRVTGAELASVPVDGQGDFVAMFNLAPSAAPRVLSMRMALPDGTVVPADATVVIGPTMAPAQIAQTTQGAVAEAAVADATGDAPSAASATAAAPAALLVTEDGAKVLQSASGIAPELVANVTIDTITYTAAGEVQLAGRGTAERVVRLYLDNAQVAEAPIGATGDWAVTLSDVAPGVYVLRADQLDETGKVTSRFETPFQRETVEALAAASGVEPVDATADEATAAAVAVVTAEPSPMAPATVTVQPGFTLWRIATENLGEGIRYVQVFEANKDQIRDPDLIYPGQVFTIPAIE